MSNSLVRQIRFFEGRKHKYRKRKSSVKGLSSVEIYERKQKQRRERAEEIDKSANLTAYIDWISGIQRKLGLSNENFARKLGISCQTVKLWKRKSGHFPSERTFRKLLELEIETRIPVTILRIKYGVRF